MLPDMLKKDSSIRLSDHLLSLTEIRDAIVAEIHKQSHLLREPEAEEANAGKKICYLFLALSQVDNMNIPKETKKTAVAWASILGLPIGYP